MNLTFFAFFVTTALSGEINEGFAPPQGPAMEAVQLLQSAESKTEIEEIEGLFKEAVTLLGPQSPAADKLRQALTKPAEIGDLRQAGNEVLEMLTFVPRYEADLPEGFPTYTPAGVIELKVYSKNRRAIAKQFFTLFGHITRNQIAMTTPVRMEFDRGKNGKLKQESMAFYYGKPTIGSVGVQGNIQVVEQAGEMVVALGHRGSRDKKVIAEGERRLRAWLAEHPEYESNGNLVVMGYNSPMVPPKSQFFEIQLPVKQSSAP